MTRTGLRNASIFNESSGIITPEARVARSGEDSACDIRPMGLYGL